MLLFFTLGCSRQTQRANINVTYLGNAGFLVESGGHKIVVDAVFGDFESDWCVTPSDSVIDLIVNAKPPFDDVDVIAITHYHIDHFSPEMTVQHLLHNHNAHVVCPNQVAQMLAKSDHYVEIHGRIHAVTMPRDSSRVISVDGIGIRAIRSAHQPSGEIDSVTGKVVDRNRNTEHLEFVFSLAGNTIYHSGDVAMEDRRRYEALGFGKSPINLALVGWWDASERMSFRQVLIKEIIRPDCIILMHMSQGSLPYDNPAWQAQVALQVILPDHRMQSWTLVPFAKTEQR